MSSSSFDGPLSLWLLIFCFQDYWVIRASRIPIMIKPHTNTLQTVSNAQQPPDGSQVTKIIGLPTNKILLWTQEHILFVTVFQCNHFDLVKEYRFIFLYIWANRRLQTHWRHQSRLQQPKPLNLLKLQFWLYLNIVCCWYCTLYNLIFLDVNPWLSTSIYLARLILCLI